MTTLQNLSASERTDLELLDVAHAVLEHYLAEASFIDSDPNSEASVQIWSQIDDISDRKHAICPDWD